MSEALHWLSLEGAAAAIADRSVTSLELTELATSRFDVLGEEPLPAAASRKQAARMAL